MSALAAVGAVARQARSLEHVDHRPWALPEGSARLGQSWEKLLFAHWALPPDAVRPHVPPGLALDLYDGRAWIGVTPFCLTGFRLIGLPPVPRLSSFPELNVRTYASAGGKPGIWFLSLDAGSRLAVAGARRIYRLPYFNARIEVAEADGAVLYRSERRDSRGHPARFSVRFLPAGPAAAPERGSLDHFLTERYCLYARGPEGLLRAEIHHPPWQLRPASAEIGDNSMPPPGLQLAGEPDLLHWADRQDVLVWAPASAGPAGENLTASGAP